MARSCARGRDVCSGSRICEPLERRTLLAAAVSGVMRQWYPVTLDFAGPTASETDNAPNPFLDYRLQVAFTSPSGKRYDVPGYFNTDGHGGTRGNVWEAKFTPSESGTWSYKTSFRKGSKIAVDLNANDGTATSFDGSSGSFSVSSRDPNAAGFHKWGELQYAGGHYLKFKDGPYFVKTGTNEPEDFLGYKGFDNQPNAWHSYSGHVQDWHTGDPDWGNGKGKGIIGAVNYFADHDVNSLYFIVHTEGTKTGDVWPWVGPVARDGSPADDNTHYDVSKMAQWDIVFGHMENRDVVMHLVFSATHEANKRELDDGLLGPERKLLYREMIARFGYHNGIEWNVTQEYNWRYVWPVDLIKSMAGYIRAVDPYDHPITVHHAYPPEGKPGTTESWLPFYGQSNFDITSFQYYKGTAGNGAEIERWRAYSESKGKPIPISIDEELELTPTNQSDMRKDFLWPTLLSGGNLEWSTDTYMWCDDFRRYDSAYRYTDYAQRLMQQIPFWLMHPNDGLLTGESTSHGGGQVFDQHGEAYAIYLPSASATGALDLSGTTATFTERWYNPRTGNYEGTSRTVTGGKTVALGAAPSSSSEDWVVVLTKSAAAAPATPVVNSVALINADTNKTVSGFTNLTSGATIRLSSIGTKNINFVAAGSSSTQSIKFVLTGTNYSKAAIESTAPYALFGDNNAGDYYAWAPTAGTYTLKVTPYSADKALGTAGATKTITFTITA